MADIDTAAPKDNFAVVAGHGPDEVALYFYSYLFLRYPQTREMFPPAMTRQRDRLVGALVRIVTNVEGAIISIDGHDFVKYQGLLDLGHQKGISQIEVDPIQLPTKDNEFFAVCKATVVSKTGESFVDIGDANPGNCSSKVSKHLLRLASTRAIATTGPEISFIARLAASAAVRCSSSI